MTSSALNGVGVGSSVGTAVSPGVVSATGPSVGAGIRLQPASITAATIPNIALSTTDNPSLELRPIPCRVIALPVQPLAVLRLIVFLVVFVLDLTPPPLVADIPF